MSIRAPDDIVMAGSAASDPAKELCLEPLGPSFPDLHHKFGRIIVGPRREADKACCSMGGNHLLQIGAEHGLRHNRLVLVDGIHSLTSFGT